MNFQLTPILPAPTCVEPVRLTLAGDYPVNAQLNFGNLTYSGLAPLLSSTAGTFDGSAEGQVNISGPLSRTQDLRGKSVSRNWKLTRALAGGPQAPNQL